MSGGRMPASMIAWIWSLLPAVMLEMVLARRGNAV